MVRVNTHKLSLIQQQMLLKTTFSKSNVQIVEHKKMIWKYQLKPTPLSLTYDIKLTYCMGERPHVYVIKPMPLKLAAGELSLPHVYDNDKQELCLFWKNWDATMPLASTIVPWIADWLYYYEVWLFTGEWEGGGIHFDDRKPYRKI